MAKRRKRMVRKFGGGGGAMDLGQASLGWDRPGVGACRHRTASSTHKACHSVCRCASGGVGCTHRRSQRQAPSCCAAEAPPSGGGRPIWWRGSGGIGGPLKREVTMEIEWTPDAVPVPHDRTVEKQAHLHDHRIRATSLEVHQLGCVPSASRDNVVRNSYVAV